MYINIVNCSKFFLSELEEMKSCIYRVETTNAAMGLYWLWHHLLVLLLEETGSTERVCKLQSVTRICNHYQMLPLHIAELCICNGKRLNGKNRNVARGK